MAVTLIGKVTTKAPTIRSYSLYGTKRNYIHLRAWCCGHNFSTFGDSGKGSTFGAAWDIYIVDHANSNMESYAFLGGNRVYQLPDGVGINVNS